jgi:hypothetical protein
MYHMLLCQEKTFSLKMAEWLRQKHVGQYANVIVQWLVLLINFHIEIQFKHKLRF